MEDRIARLEQRLRRMQRLNWFYLGALVILGVVAFKAAPPEVIRTKGIVIEDEQGRERILIGAPIPAAKNRARTDMEKVKKQWGSHFPPQYLEYYKNYRNDMNGLLVLDENGIDRVGIGHDYPDPNIGQRIGRGTGV